MNTAMTTRSPKTVAAAAFTARGWEVRPSLPSPRTEFGTGYGRSSGYAARRSYVPSDRRSTFRIG